MQKLQVGQKICAGRFEIQSLLGIGGSGEVYLARDLTSEAGDGLVALKVYADGSGEDTPVLELHARIHREAEALSKTKSDSIVKALDIVSEGAMTILVQEYLAGGSLQDAIRRDPSEYRKAKMWLTIAHALAEGLDVVHAAGLTHGDIKPANIGFRDFAHRHPVYLDFGQAALVNRSDFLTRSAQAMATLPYLAPERTGFIKASRDEQADLYSLGATLYEMAAGHPPFQEANPKALLEKILNGVPQPLSEVVANFPEPLSDIVQKLLRKNPDDRYFTARGLAADLQECVRHLESGNKIPTFALAKNDRFRELNSKARFVGRRAELSKLLNQLNETLAGRGGCAFIGAPSGAGKSRLCYEVGVEASQKSVLTLVGKFSEFERNVPLSGILSIIHSYLREIQLEPQHETAGWARRVGAKLGAKLRLLTQRLSFLRDIFNFTHELPKQEFEDEQKTFLEGLVELLVEMGSRHEALILILDDLQWADGESLGVIEVIATRARKSSLGKLLMLGCYRSNEVNQEHPLQVRVLQHEGPQAHVQLGPLSEDESNTLVEHLLDESGHQVTRLQRMTYLLTQGNPFYVREYLGFCLSREIFRPDESGSNWIFDAAKAQSASLSHGIASLVSDRINELNADSKQILLVASAVGNEVHLAAIDFLLREKQLNTPLLRCLSELSEQHLIYFNRDTLTFVHDKVREAAYQLAGHELRTDCHQGYAVWLHRKMGVGDDEQKRRIASNELFELAYHLKNGRPQKQPEWSREILLQAGRMALKVFAYQKALEYAQTAHQLLPDDCTANQQLLSEFVQITELLADARVLNEDPVGAVDLYTSIITYTDDMHKTEILAKLCECNLTLFRYRDSIAAGEQGMRYLNKKIDISEFRALLVVISRLIPFTLSILFWPLFGRQKNTIESREDQVFFKLLVSMQVALFFSRPICAISNQMRYTMEILKQKPNRYRAILIGYWAVVFGVFGIAKISNALYRNSLQYFEQHPDPIFRAFLLFTWGYLNEFPRARLREAHSKHVQALDILENAGDSFWRVLTMQGLIHMDEYGLGNGETYALHSRYTNLIFRIKQTPTILDAVLRHHLLTKNTSELNRYESIVREAATAIRSDGFDTIDSCYANISLGEINLLREDPHAALPYLREAFRAVCQRVHRVSYCIFAPVLLATCYIRLNRPFAAFPALTLAWVNQVFAARLLMPKTIYISGEMFYRSGLRLFGRWFAQMGIKKAQRLRLPATLFELRLQLANLIVEEDPDYAQVIFRMCREYFSEKQYLFFVDRCDRGIMRAQIIMDSRQERVHISGQSTSRNSKTEVMRQRVELESLLQVFLNLSALNEKDPLLDSVLDAMCKCTGVEYGVLFLFEEGKLVPVRARGTDLHNLQQNLNPAWGVDKWFLEKCEQDAKREPRIRPSAWRTPHPACDGSAMVVPLPFKEKIYGYCYLANSEANDYFDARSQRVVSPLAAQAAIAYQNFILAAAKEEQARLDAEINAARAVQDALLPSQIQVPATHISYFYESASQTGGDWFHHHYDPVNHRLYAFVGDVTGHGLPSALLTAVVSGAVLAHLRKEIELAENTQLSLEESLNELAEIANYAVFSAGSRSNRFMTMCFACLDLTNGELGVVSAGHTPPYILSQGANRVQTLPCSGSLLGFSEKASFGFTSCRLNAGDSVLIYTDGLLENTTVEGPLLTSRGLRSAMKECATPEKCIEMIAKKVTEASKQQPLDDDVTVYMFRWDGQPAAILPAAG
ncbi:MAG: Serine/threonine-protein kinase PknL [Pseudomonadota bacterium]|jgi:serine/threonine protein kinase/serine phosphatase RsbU (regulator of sigma subunit)